MKQVVTWARENMELSGLDGIRWIVEDALKSCSAKSAVATVTTASSSIPRPTGGVPTARKGFSRTTSARCSSAVPGLLEPRGAFLVLNLYSMGLSSTLARTAVRQAFGAPRTEQYGELCFTDRAGKQLPLGTYYRFTR